MGRKDVESVLRRGLRTERGPMRLYWRTVSGDLPSTFSLSIKSGSLKRAVDRNRWKRIVREAVRSSGYLRSRGFEAVFILTRSPDIELSFDEWEPVVVALLHTAGAC